MIQLNYKIYFGKVGNYFSNFGFKTFFLQLCIKNTVESVLREVKRKELPVDRFNVSENNLK